MVRVANAFKFRAADATLLDTTGFLRLYCPLLLNVLEPDDLAVPKLLVLRGSPGSGKSSLLRLFETETLKAIQIRRRQKGKEDEPLIEHLQRLGALSDDNLRVIGIYINCDSSLRDIASLYEVNLRGNLLNTILDVRIVNGFLQAVQSLVEAGLLPVSVQNEQLVPLQIQDMPPTLFATAHSLSSLREACERVMADFGQLLNSFPGDPIPPSIQPHARLFSLTYLQQQQRPGSLLADLTPLVMLDDLHELEDTQREQVFTEFKRRSGIPRWVAVRKHVYELEELISLRGLIQGREFRETDLDSGMSQIFTRFVADVARKRFSLSAALQPYSITGFEAQLAEPPESFPRAMLENKLLAIERRLRDLRVESPQYKPLELPALVGEDPVKYDSLVEVMAHWIQAERKRQPNLFGEFEPPDSKTINAAYLFAAHHFKLPYYNGFRKLAEAANFNVQQFLSLAGILVDRMIFRLEMGKEALLTAEDQHELLKSGAQRYYEGLEEGHLRGYFIKQLVDNLGRFFQAFSYRPNAPVSPGINGFGLERHELKELLEQTKTDPQVSLFREVLLRAVAGNVFFVNQVKQGKPGSEKIVFYLNRLLCMRYNLPLNRGGWQILEIAKLVHMMQEPVPAKDWGKKWKPQLTLDFGEMDNEPEEVG